MADHQEKLFTKDTILVMAATFLFQFLTMAVNPLINGMHVTLAQAVLLPGSSLG